MEESLCRFYCFFISALLLEIDLSRGEIVIPLISLTQPRCCACTIPGSEFPLAYVLVFFVFNDFMQEVVVRFADIGTIVRI